MALASLRNSDGWFFLAGANRAVDTGADAESPTPFLQFRGVKARMQIVIPTHGHDPSGALPMLLTSICISVVFVVVVWLCALGGSRSGYLGAACVSLAGVGLALCSGVLTMLLVSLLVGIVAIVCAVTQARRRSFYVGSLAAVITAYRVVVVLLAIPEQREWAGLERAYPVESLEGRLPQIRRAKQTDAGPASGAASSQHLDSFEEYFDSRKWSTERREISLRELHSSSVNRFIQSRGFGAARMLFRPTPEAVPLSDPEPITMPIYDPEALGSHSAEKYPDEGHRQSDANDLHESSLMSFLDPVAFGYVKDRKHVIGFQPHAFRYTPSVPRTWHIDKLELVSLLNHEEPAVYLSEHLPRMSELRDAATRPLDDFEKGALTALQKGEDIRVQSSPEQIRMLGSIRAVKQCLKCHDVDRGYLLGAFTYDLRKGP